MQSSYQPPQLSSSLSSKLQLFISCTNLKDVDIVGYSDPFVLVEMREGSEQQWRQIGKTEVVKDNLNPAFQTSFMITYYFEKH